MGRINVRKSVIVLIHAFVGWALCGATMGIGMAVTSEQNTLAIHAIGVPVFFVIVSLVYFRKFGYTTPLQTAIAFVAFAVFMDVFVVSLLILRSFEMFASVLGAWIPLVLIFVSTYLTGVLSLMTTDK